MYSLAFYVRHAIIPPMMISAPQCRAARGLLGISQGELAAQSEVGLRTIAGFESGKTTPIKANLSAIQRAFEAAGVEFIENGVKLKKAAM